MSRSPFIPSTLARLPFAVVSALVLLSLGACAAPADDHLGTEEPELNRTRYEKGTVLRVTSQQLNVRDAGNTSSNVLATLMQDDLVTVALTSGAWGWVRIETADGVIGWGSNDFLEPVDGSGATAPAPSGRTCAPSRAVNAVNRYEKALHDTIAYAEGTRNVSNDGYDILFGYSVASSCVRHPNTCIPFRNTCSTAAGRYQFLTRTWNTVARANGFTTFEPENQERGTEYLIDTIRRAHVPSNRALTSSEFSNVITKLSYEWASLPPGQYAQPMRSMSSLRSLYCSLVAC